MYRKRWRKCHKNVEALAAESSSDKSECHVPDNVCTTPPINPSFSSNESSPEQLESDLSSLSESDSDTSNVHWLSTSENNEQSDSDVEDNSPFSEPLATWATKANITRSGTNELVEILRKQGHCLPKDARTRVIGTPQVVTLGEKCGGRYYYFGIKFNILQILKQNPVFIESNDNILLKINIDGVPLFKSTNTQMWPIMGHFGGLEPFVIALYCGQNKPNSVQEYMSDFLHE